MICFLFATDDPNAIKLIESSTSGIIGSVLGGITAGISIIFGILSSLKDKFPQITNNNAQFLVFIDNLKLDIMVLITCLTLSIALPYLRATGIPYITLPVGDYVPTSSRLYTTAELTIISISIFALIDIISTMFYVFKVSMTSSNVKENK